MAEEKKRNIDIGGDATDSVNITGDGNLTLKNASIGQLVVIDSKIAPADIRDYVAETGKKPYEIPGVNLHNLPFPRNPMFTGREELLKKLHESLTASGSTALSQPPAISGLGGIGKTQIAIEYAYRHIDEYKVVLWVNSDGKAAITASYSEIARLLDLPQKDEKDLSVVIGAVRSWLEANKEWLLIYDNADEPEIITEYQLRSHDGRILITSKAVAFGNLANALVVKKMAEGDAVDFLLKRAKIGRKENTDLESAMEICAEFDLFPLAIGHAGSFVEATGCSLSEYLKIFREKGIEVLKDKRYTSKEYDFTVATTWSMSLEKLQKDSPAAVEIMRLCAFFAPDAIPLELIKAGADSFEEPLKSVVSDPFEFSKALGDLQRYSLIKRKAGQEEISVHRLLQAVITENLGESEARKWVELAVGCLSDALPDLKDYRNWPQCERLIPHILMILRHADSLNISNETVGLLLNEAGYYLKQRADYAQVGPLYRRALEVHEEVHGPEHPLVATSLNNLAGLYYTQGKYAKAEPLYQRALEIKEKVLGPVHPDVAIRLNNLAELFRVQGKYTEAEPHCRRALEITEKALGPEHPDVAIRLNNLATLYYNQGKYAEAEPLHRRSLEIREKALGTGHPSVAISLNNLALLYKIKGKYVKAEPLYLRALEITEKALGSEHPSVAIRLHNLGTLLYELGREKEGIEMVRRAYRIFRDILGPDHLNTKTSLKFLGSKGVKPE